MGSNNFLKKRDELKKILISFNNETKKLNRLFEDISREASDHSFTLDGHLVGTMGECLASALYPNLELKINSNGGYDAILKLDTSELEIEIKSTTIGRVVFNKDYKRVLIVKIYLDDIERKEDWVKFFYEPNGVKLGKNKTRSLSISKLKEWKGELI